MLMQCVSMSNEKDLNEMFPTPKSMYYIILVQINDQCITVLRAHPLQGFPVRRPPGLLTKISNGLSTLSVHLCTLFLKYDMAS